MLIASASWRSCLCADSPQDSKRSEAVFDKGVTLFKQQRYEEALAYFRNAHDAGIERPKSAYYVALCYHQMGQTQAAHEAYKFVCTRYPNAPVAAPAFSNMKKLALELAGIQSPASTVPRDLKDTGAKNEFSANPHATRDGASAAPRVAGEYVLRFTDEAMDGRMYLDGTIDGKDVKMLFDTGSSVMFCRQSFLDKQRISVKFKGKERTAGASSEAATRTAAVRISVGPIVKDDILYVEQDRPDSLYPYFDNCPIIGQSFFRNYLVDIDGPNKVIRLQTPRAQRKTTLDARDVPFERESDHIIVNVAVNGRECKMILDTGASQVVFSDRLLAQIGLNRPADARNSVRSGAEGKRESFVFNIGSMRLGPIQQNDVEANVLMNSKISRPLLGQTFLAPLKYSIDPINNVIHFQNQTPAAKNSGSDAGL